MERASGWTNDILNVLYLCQMRAHQRKTVNLRITEHLVLPKYIALYRMKREGKEREKREYSESTEMAKKKKIPSDSRAQDGKGWENDTEKICALWCGHELNMNPLRHLTPGCYKAFFQRNIYSSKSHYTHTLYWCHKHTHSYTVYAKRSLKTERFQHKEFKN